MTPRNRRPAGAVVDRVREAVLHILLRVERDRAYANLLLEAAAADLSARDAAFCTALTLGTLRRRAQLDWVLDRLLRRPITEAAVHVRQVLRLGAYQILHMDVRKAAAVDEAVKLAKAHASPNAAKLVNAVLRRVDRDDAFAALHALDVRRVSHWSVLTGVPEWYARAVHAVWPGERGAAVCAAATTEPALTVRVNTARTDAPGLIAALRDAHIGAGAHPLVPGLVTVYCPAPVLVRSAPFTAGLGHVQDGSAALAALALGTQPGDRVADLCAAPGGKAAILAAQAGPGGSVTAVEKVPRRAALVRDLAQREGLANLHVMEADATAPAAGLEAGTFDRVLVDAPCSALGIARHRPDLLWHPAPDPARDHVPTQRALLDAGVRLLKPGGVLVYSTCTFAPDEGEGVVAAALAAQPDVTPDSLPPVLDRWTQRPGHATIAPGDGGLDGFTIVRIRRAV